jgi:hypothetical protein
MLEANSLLLKPVPTLAWQSTPSRHLPGRKTIEIIDPAGDVRVGTVFELTPPSHISWLAARALAVYETEDLSLVFSVRRGRLLPLSWTVKDADGKRVGSLIQVADLLLYLRAARGASEGKRSSKLSAVTNGAADQWTGRFIGRSGHELASLTVAGEGTFLSFACRLETEPLTKMMILAATVIRI